jgi:hypothetical protein
MPDRSLEQWAEVDAEAPGIEVAALWAHRRLIGLVEKAKVSARGATVRALHKYWSAHPRRRELGFDEEDGDTGEGRNKRGETKEERHNRALAKATAKLISEQWKLAEKVGIIDRHYLLHYEKCPLT